MHTMTSHGRVPLGAPKPCPFLTPELPALKSSGRASQGPFLPKARLVCSLAATTTRVQSSLGLVVMQNTHPVLARALPFIPETSL